MLGISTKHALSALCAGLSTALLGCFGGLIALGGGSDARYRHRELGYEVAFPTSAEGESWERFPVDGADLAFRTRAALPDGSPLYSTISLQSACRATVRDPEVLARRLRAGLPALVLLEGSETEVDGLIAWQQVFDTRERSRAVRIKTVTAPDDDCTFDWVLVARGAFEPLERSFDSWWGSFRRASLVVP